MGNELLDSYSLAFDRIQSLESALASERSAREAAESTSSRLREALRELAAAAAAEDMIERRLLGRWKLGRESWIELVTEGPFGESEMEKLRRYIELLEPDPAPKPPAPDAEKGGGTDGER